MNILLADDHPEVRSALRLLLEQRLGSVLIGEAAEDGTTLAQAAILHPDLVLLDWELPGQPAVELLSALRSLCPKVLVIALSGRPEAREEALEAGVDGFVSKGDPPERVLAGIGYCLRDEMEMPSSLTD